MKSPGNNVWTPLLIAVFISIAAALPAQSPERTFTRADTLRGSITPERAWWDLTFYELDVAVDIAGRSIRGSNTVHYRVLEPGEVLQIDLQPPLRLEKIVQDGRELTWKAQGPNAYFVQLAAPQPAGSLKSLTVHYGGPPKVAQNAPWDGGFSWAEDREGGPFVATSCQGLGASVWWPCKDHMYDEPDSMSIAVRVPAGLTDVSNGRLRRVTGHADSSQTFHWFVRNPINNYGVNVNIARYAHFNETFEGEKGTLTLDYYVLPADLEKARKQFQQVKPMLKAFEHWFGPYPFYEDGYKLVQVPYLGMEHQSCVTYGNGFQNGYLGKDLSASGWGQKWDFIIIHESGHEWFANNITYKDIADMWVHESFTAYSECLYTEFHYGKEAGAAYVTGTRNLIRNDSPIVGTYGVNAEGSGDMYYKGSNMLHTIRQVVNDDEKWRQILRGLNRDFYHRTVDGKEIEAYISQKAGRDLSKVFDQYLRSTQVPALDYKLRKGKLSYRWNNCVPGFDMPVRVTLRPGEFDFIYPTTEWNTVKTTLKSLRDFAVDPDFYVDVERP
jgi:aminopeptidase N